MVNQDILTSLKNAVERGESLSSAKRVAINSGYNPGEVEEASRYVGGGIMQEINPSPERYLTMPTQKRGFFSRKVPSPAKPVIQNPEQIKKVEVEASTIKNEINRPTQVSPVNVQKRNLFGFPKKSISSNEQKEIIKPLPEPTIINPPQSNVIEKNNEESNEMPIPINPVNIEPPRMKKKKGWMKEIILLIILLILIGVLIFTVLYRDMILSLLS